MPKINATLMAKAKRQATERYAANLYRIAAETPKPKSYRIRLKGADKFSEGVYTMDDFVSKLDAAIRAYELVEVKEN